MIENFERAFLFIVSWEHYKYDDNRNKYILGLSSEKYKNINKLWNEEENIVKEKIKKIYKQDYWDSLELDIVESPKDIILFDVLITMGISSAVHFEQYDLNEIFMKIIERCSYIYNGENSMYFKNHILRITSLYNYIKLFNLINSIEDEVREGNNAN